MLKHHSLAELVFATFATSFLVVIPNVAPSQVKEPDAAPQKSTTKPDDGDGRPVSDLRQFMRGKLSASNKILEGLTTEDMALVKEGARELNKMSLSEKWRASNDGMYQQFSAEFRRITNDLNSAADDNNLDQATLKWMAATMTCIECHRFVRNTLVVDLGEME